MGWLHSGEESGGPLLRIVTCAEVMSLHQQTNHRVDGSSKGRSQRGERQDIEAGHMGLACGRALCEVGAGSLGYHRCVSRSSSQNNVFEGCAEAE